MRTQSLLVLALMMILSFSALAQHELFDYVRSCTGQASWELVRKEESGLWEIRLQSQIWRGIPWTHRVLLLDPPDRVAEDVVLLYISADPYPGEELLGWAVARAAGLRVAILNSVPNQPIFGLREDALIAYTFERYLLEGGADWPLLFPMVQSVLSAMDAISALAQEFWGGNVQGFILAGASKRGWTTYLTAAVDSRVLGIIPIVFDFLNIPAQLARQEELLGGPSPKLQDYTARGLTTLADPSPQAVKLVFLVDPYSYRHAYTMPKLVVVGANDPYWVTDATALYWPGLPEPKLLHVVPNVGHNVILGDGVLSTVAAFARLVAQNRDLPQIQNSLRFAADGVKLSVHTDWPVKEAWLWMAEFTLPDLDRARWRAQTLSGGEGAFAANLQKNSGYLGFFAELVFEIDGLQLRSSTPIRILGP